MLQGHEPGARYKLWPDRVTAIGRSSQNDISLVSPTVSRFHCEIAFLDGLWNISDLNSKKGTIVNNEKIADRVVLKPGDIIRLSTNVFRFDLIDESSEPNEGLLALKEAALNVQMEPKAGISNGSLEAIRERGRIDLVEKKAERKARREGSRRLAPTVVLFAFGSLLICGATGAVYGLRTRQVRDQRDAAARLAQSAERELEGLKALMAGPDVDLNLAGQQMAAFVGKYPRTEAARTVVETLYPRLQAMKAERQWHDVEATLAKSLELERNSSFQAAINVLRAQRDTAADPALEAFYTEQERRVRAVAAAAYAEREAAANDALKENDRESAIAQYMEVTVKFGIPELVSRAQAKIRTIQGR